MPSWPRRSPPASRPSWKRPNISTPNCTAGSHEPSLAYRSAARYRSLVLSILDTKLPRNAKVWVFGSRATGRARSYSDLDLAIDAGRRLNLDDLAGLTEALSDSDLPHRVDIVDWHGIDDRWRQTIAADRAFDRERTSRCWGISQDRWLQPLAQAGLRLPSPQPFGCNRRPIGHRAQLLERDVRVELAEAGKGAEAAIGAGDHPLAADDVGEAAERSATSSGCST